MGWMKSSGGIFLFTDVSRRDPFGTDCIRIIQSPSCGRKKGN